MYNYSKNGVTINAETMATINNFNETARQQAIDSVEHNTTKHELEAKLADAIEELEKNETKQARETVTTTKQELEELEKAWKVKTAEYNTTLYGGKVDGVKVAGICDLVTDGLYKAYIDYVENGTTKKYRNELKKFVVSIINGDESDLKAGAYNHLYNDIVMTMSSVRYNSNSQLAKGASYITTINKRTYKKMLLGAIHDIVSNNRTLKVKKNK